MVWDPTKPVTDAALESAPVRGNFAALDTMVVAPLVAAAPELVLKVGSPGDVIAGITAGSNGQVLMLVSGAPAWASLLPSGTRMLFDQAAAPTGWTRDATINDRVVRLTSGTGGANGGSSWTLSGLTHAHTHTMGNHTHGMNSHTHTLAAAGDGNISGGASHEVFNNGGTLMAGSFGTGTVVTTVGATTDGPSASNSEAPSTNTTDAISTSAVSSDGTWRPLTRDMIVAVKD